MTKLFDTTTNALARSLDFHLLRHSVISDNIANAETPGFKARRVAFEEALDSAVKAHENVGSRELASVGAEVYEDPDSEMGADMNSVDMDREMSKLTKNEIQYNAAIQAVTKKFSVLKYVITEGGSR